TVVPPAPSTGPLTELVRIAHEGAEESRGVKEVALALVDGYVVKDDHGKPIVKKLSECDAMTSPSDVDKCTGLFIDVTRCRTTPPDAGGKPPLDCEHAAIAAWTATNPEQSGMPITVTEAPLVDSDGNPVKGKDGKQVVKHLADCSKPDPNLDADTCRDLFSS